MSVLRPTVCTQFGSEIFVWSWKSPLELSKVAGAELPQLECPACHGSAYYAATEPFLVIGDTS